jgi:hypothetical protein
MYGNAGNLIKFIILGRELTPDGWRHCSHFVSCLAFPKNGIFSAKIKQMHSLDTN